MAMNARYVFMHKKLNSILAELLHADSDLRHGKVIEADDRIIRAIVLGREIKGEMEADNAT